MMNTEIRKCSGVVMFRRVAATRENQARIEYLLVTATQNSERWVLPKGGIEPELTAASNAVKECREESGYAINEPTADDVVSVFLERKKEGDLQKVTIFVAEALQEVEWEEAHLRSRGWFTLVEADQLLGMLQRKALYCASVLLGDTCAIDASKKRKARRTEQVQNEAQIAQQTIA